MTILGPSDYADIRAALDTALDSTSLPDSTIARRAFLHKADLEIKRRAPAWEAYAGDDLTHLKIAATYLTASYLAYAVPVLSSETEAASQYKYIRLAASPAARAAQLEAAAWAELETLGVTAPTLSGFSVAPTRGDGYADVEAAL